MEFDLTMLYLSKSYVVVSNLKLYHMPFIWINIIIIIIIIISNTNDITWYKYDNLNIANPFSQNSKSKILHVYIVPPSDPICPFDTFFIFNKQDYMQSE